MPEQVHFRQEADGHKRIDRETAYSHGMNGSTKKERNLRSHKWLRPMGVNHGSLGPDPGSMVLGSSWGPMGPSGFL